MSWHTFETEDGQTYGRFEAFYMGNGEELERGWYWWACYPGCMPDSEPDGPYATEREAIQAGQDCP